MKRFPLLLSFLVLSSCTQTAPPRVAPAAHLAPTGIAHRVVLMSFDGMGADALARQTNLPAFDRLKREGGTARIVTVNPTVTGTAHVTILTGADPQRHGIVANRFHLPGTPPEKIAYALQTTIDVETLVEAAHRQGKRVGAVPFPSVDGTTTRRAADFGLVYDTRPLTQPRTIRLTRNDFHREWVPPTWSTPAQRRASFSPVMRARIEWALSRDVRTDVDIVAYDTTDDQVENYDAFAVENGEHEITPDANGWFAISRTTPEGLAGSWSKLVSGTRTLSEVTVYWGAITRTNAYPASFRALLDENAGFWPGNADEDADATIYREQHARLADFLLRAQTLAVERMPFDLLLAYYPTVDAVSHKLLGRDDAAVRAAFEAIDRGAAAMLARLDPSRDALVVTGDHGLLPIDTEVHMNRLLAEGGFAARWRAFASGNVAHLYRFSEPDDTDAVMKFLAATLRFESVTRKSAAMHRNSGDIVAIGFPNVFLSPSEEAPSIVRPTAAASHGASNAHREYHTALFAWGAGTRRGLLGEYPQTRVARFVSALLGIAPPAAAE